LKLIECSDVGILSYGSVPRIHEGYVVHIRSTNVHKLASQ